MNSDGRREARRPRRRQKRAEARAKRLQDWDMGHVADPNALYKRLLG